MARDRDLLAAQLSAAAYLPDLAAVATARAMGLGPVRFISVGDSQALVAGRFVAFRGTESKGDAITDLDTRRVRWLEGVTVHRGFLRAFDLLRPQLAPGPAPVFCGHSLGGALATIAAAHYGCAALVTFGCPRVGDARFAQLVESRAGEIRRYVHNNDVVPRVPPWWWGFRHPRGLRFITTDGRILAAPSEWAQLLDRLRGRWQALGAPGLDGIGDHRMCGYLDALDALRED